MLADPPDAGTHGDGFSITGAVSTNTLTSHGKRIGHPAPEHLQALLDHLVIVATLGIDADRTPVRLGQRRQGIASGTVVQANRDNGSGFGPQCPRIATALCVGLHPGHVAVAAVAKIVAKIAGVFGIRHRRRETDRIEAQFMGSGADGFLDGVRIGQPRPRYGGTP